MEFKNDIVIRSFKAYICEGSLHTVITGDTELYYLFFTNLQLIFRPL